MTGRHLTRRMRSCGGDFSCEYFRVTASDRAVELATAAAVAATDKSATDVVAFDVSDRFPLSDVFVVCSAPTDRQVRAIVDGVEERLRLLDAKPMRREGGTEARWVLLDFAEIIVHVQSSEDRSYYGLERLWKDCPGLPLPTTEVGAAYPAAAPLLAE
jgi:ribosome-associated protein